MISQYFFVLTLCYGVIKSAQAYSEIELKLPEGYVPGKNARAYKFYSQSIYWIEARQQCVDDGAHLVVLRNDADKEYFQKQLIVKNLESFWLGIRDEIHKDKWVTVTDVLLSRYGYRPWAPNQPDNHNNEGQYCGVLKLIGVDDIRCEALRPFFCEIYLDK